MPLGRLRTPVAIFLLYIFDHWDIKNNHLALTVCVRPIPYSGSYSSVIGETFLYDNSVHQRGQRLGYRMLNNPNQFAFEWFLRLRGPLTLYDVGTTLLHDGLGLED